MDRRTWLRLAAAAICHFGNGHRTLRHRRARGMGGAQAHLPAFAAAPARLLPLFSDGAVWEPSRDAPARETRHMPYRQAL